MLSASLNKTFLSLSLLINYFKTGVTGASHTVGDRLVLKKNYLFILIANIYVICQHLFILYLSYGK